MGVRLRTARQCLFVKSVCVSDTFNQNYQNNLSSFRSSSYDRLLPESSIPRQVKKLKQINCVMGFVICFFILFKLLIFVLTR